MLQLMSGRPHRHILSFVLAAALALALPTCTSPGGVGDGGGEGGGRALATAEAPVVYGADDRVDVYAYPQAAWRDRALLSSVALMDLGTLDLSNPNDVAFQAGTLGAAWGLCADEWFRSQPTAAFCSGSLVDDDLVLTAGHCVTRSSECAATAFVFRYVMASAGGVETVTVDDVFYCDQIVERVETTTLDYALIRLDRPATPRFAPAPVQTEAQAVPLGRSLTMIGCPSGIPFKIEDGGWVRDNRAGALDYLVANTDSFGGNSGSGVYDQTTGLLVGVLVRGETDYVYDYLSGCYRVNRCGDNECSGEDSTYAFRAVEALCAGGHVSRLCGPICGDGTCDADESTATCPDDCGSACGDGVCNGAETNTSCPADCPAGPVCGDGVCAGGGEDCFTCAADCDCAGRGCSKVCCGDGVCSRDEDRKGFCAMDCFATYCGDGVCDPDESTATCAPDCGTACGDGACNGAEDEVSCPDDCSAPPPPPSACGDGVCAGWEAGEDCTTCSADCRCAGKDCTKVCCGDGVCSADEGNKGFCPIDCPL